MKAKSHGLSPRQEFVLAKMRDGLRLWHSSVTFRWGLERPIRRDLQEEEAYEVAEVTAASLRRRRLIEPDGTLSSLRRITYYRMNAEVLHVPE